MTNDQVKKHLTDAFLMNFDGTSAAIDDFFNAECELDPEGDIWVVHSDGCGHWATFEQKAAFCRRMWAA